MQLKRHVRRQYLGPSISDKKCIAFAIRSLKVPYQFLPLDWKLLDYNTDTHVNNMNYIFFKFGCDLKQIY